MNKKSWKSVLLLFTLGLFSITTFSQNVKIPYLKDGKWGFSDETGSLLYEPIFDSVSFFKEGRAEVYQDKKIGLLDSSLKYFILRPEYQELKWVNVKEKVGAVIIAKKEGKYGLIDKYVSLLIPYEFEKIRIINTGKSYYAYCNKNNFFIVFQLKGYSVSTLHSEKDKILGYNYYNGGIYFYSESTKYKHDYLGRLTTTEKGTFSGKKKYQQGSDDYDDSFEEIEDILEKPVWSETFATKGKTGLYYNHREWDFKVRRKIIKVDTIPAIYDSIVVQPIYASNRNHAKFRAVKNGKWGIVGVNNNETIPFKFDSIQYFRNRVCFLFLNGKIGAVKITDDKYPTHLLDIKYTSIQQTDNSWNSNFIVTLNEERFYVFRNDTYNPIPIKNYEIGWKTENIKGFKLISVTTKSGQKAYIGENGVHFFEE